MTSYYDPYSDRRAAIERRRKMADALREQSASPLESQMAGGYVVPISPLQGAAKLAQALASSKSERDAEAQEKSLNEEIRSKRSSALASALKGGQPDYQALVNSDDPELQNLGLELSIKAAERERELRQKTKTQVPAEEVVAMGYPQGSVLYRDALGNVNSGYTPDVKSQKAQDQALELARARTEMTPYQQMQISNQQYGNQLQAANLQYQGVPVPGPAAPQSIPEQPAQQQAPQAPAVPASIPSMPDQGQLGPQMPLNPKTQQEIAAKREEARPQAQRAVSESSANLGRLEEAANSLLNHPGLGRISGATGAVPDMPGSDAADARSTLNTLKSQIFVNVLQAMREASKTGGAVGNVSNMEGARFENNLASLETAQSEPALRKALQDIVRYSQEARSRMTQAYESEYGGATQPTDSNIDDLLKKYANPPGT